MGNVRGLFLLRKNKIFNKSRYARNRQTTRVAFYLAILINILVIFVVFILYYKVLLKFSLIWPALFIFLASFLFSSCLRSSAAVSLKNFSTFMSSLWLRRWWLPEHFLVGVARFIAQSPLSPAFFNRYLSYIVVHHPIILALYIAKYSAA